jgi:putative MFS transporter
MISKNKLSFANNSNSLFNATIIVAALGYFVDIYDLLLFLVERRDSLKELLGMNASNDYIQTIGKQLLNWQMGGMLLGGIFWGILGDKKGRVSVLFGSIFLYSVANIANGFVETIPQYAALRFISGFGLAGELGAGITLVSESMSKEKRGLGTMIVATIGVFGAVVTGIMGNVIENWRHSFFIGGCMGLLLLVLRIGVFESGMFQSIKASHIKKGNFLALFSSPQQTLKYLRIILIAVPVWYVMGVLVGFAPELMAKLGVTSFQPENGNCIMFAYLGITLGDFGSGLLSHYLKSRRKALLVFVLLTAIGIISYFTIAIQSKIIFYSCIFFIGFATGYWAVFMSTASELFGTNIRSTVTTTAPNFVRGSLILVTLLIDFVANYFDRISAIIIVGVLVILLALISVSYLEETFHKELDYLEN